MQTQSPLENQQDASAMNTTPSLAQPKATHDNANIMPTTAVGGGATMSGQQEPTPLMRKASSMIRKSAFASTPPPAPQEGDECASPRSPEMLASTQNGETTSRNDISYSSLEQQLVPGVESIGLAETVSGADEKEPSFVQLPPTLRAGRRDSGEVDPYAGSAAAFTMQQHHQRRASMSFEELNGNGSMSIERRPSHGQRSMSGTISPTSPLQTSTTSVDNKDKDYWVGQSKINVMCRHYLEGKCNRGVSCRFTHGRDDQGPRVIIKTNTRVSPTTSPHGSRRSSAAISPVNSASAQGRQIRSSSLGSNQGGLGDSTGSCDFSGTMQQSGTFSVGHCATPPTGAVAINANDGYNHQQQQGAAPNNYSLPQYFNNVPGSSTPEGHQHNGGSIVQPGDSPRSAASSAVSVNGYSATGSPSASPKAQQLPQYQHQGGGNVHGSTGSPPPYAPQPAAQPAPTYSPQPREQGGYGSSATTGYNNHQGGYQQEVPQHQQHPQQHQHRKHSGSGACATAPVVRVGGRVTPPLHMPPGGNNSNQQPQPQPQPQPQHRHQHQHQHQHQ